MPIKTIKSQGEYLGFCDQKGYIYSLPKGYDNIGRMIYEIYSVKNGQVESLISFAGVTE